MSLLLTFKKSSEANFAPLPTLAAAPNGAWGTVKLRDAYSGYAFRVRRADLVTLDIGFLANGYADWAAVDTFLTATTGSINLIYDQSGNSYNLTATTGNPQCLGNSVNGRRSITFNSGAVNQQMLNTSIPFTNIRNTSVLWVGQAGAAQASGGIFEIGNPTTRAWIGTFTDEGAVNNDFLGECQVTSPMAYLYVGNGASAVTSKQNDMVSTTGAKASNAATGFTIMNALSGGIATPARGEVLAVVTYDATLSAGDQTTLQNWGYTLGNITNKSLGDVCVFQGDSLSLGSIDPSPATYQNSWNYQLTKNFTTRAYTYYNLSLSGRTAATMNANATHFADYAFRSGQINTVIVWGGTNDLAASSVITAATVYASLVGIADKYYTAGFQKVIMGTCMPRNAAFSGGQSRAGFETQRLALNVLIRAGEGVDFDELADVGGDAVVGQDANVTATYFYDFLHQTTLGHTYTYPYFFNALTAIG